MDQSDVSLLLDMSLDDITKMRKEASKAEKAERKPATKATPPVEPYATGGKVCLNCLKPGHVRAKCPHEKVCAVCGKSDHVKADCPKLKESCRLCGQVGHMQSRCLNAARVAAQTTAQPESALGHCFVCGSTAHRKAACPHANKTCSVCNEVGHLRSVCPKAQMPAGARAGVVAAVGRPVLPSVNNDAPISTAVPKACFACGSVAHARKNCPHKAQICELCGKQGHFAALCPMTRK